MKTYDNIYNLINVVYSYIYIYMLISFLEWFFQRRFLDITIKGNFKKFFGKKIF